jgi:hypothetical protein
MSESVVFVNNKTRKYMILVSQFEIYTNCIAAK